MSPDEKSDLDLFQAGFAAETPPQQTAKPDDKPAEKEPPAPVAETPPEPPPPEYVQVTKEQFESLQASASKTTEFEKQLSKAFGTMGAMQQTIRKMADAAQAATPSGQSVEISKDAFAELEKEYPEFAEQMRRELGKALKNIRGTGQGNGASIEPEALQTLIHEATVKQELEALEDAHPTWREIVGVVDAEGKHDENHPFRKWLASQDAAYQTKINSTNSATVIARAIDKFIAASKVTARPASKPATKAAASRDRIRDAIQPKGDGGQPAPTKSATDDFREGFASG